MKFLNVSLLLSSIICIGSIHAMEMSSDTGSNDPNDVKIKTTLPNELLAEGIYPTWAKSAIVQPTTREKFSQDNAGAMAYDEGAEDYFYKLEDAIRNLKKEPTTFSKMFRDNKYGFLKRGVNLQYDKNDAQATFNIEKNSNSAYPIYEKKFISGKGYMLVDGNGSEISNPQEEYKEIVNFRGWKKDYSTIEEIIKGEYLRQNRFKGS